jgi:glutaredoxin-related protein
MTYLLPNANEAPLKTPEDIVIKTCLGKPELFIKGTENTPDCGLKINPSGALTQRNTNR